MMRLIVVPRFWSFFALFLFSCSIDEGQERPGLGLKIHGNENAFRGTQLLVKQGTFQDQCIFEESSHLDYDCKVGFRSGDLSVILIDPNGCQMDLGKQFYGGDKIIIWNLSLSPRPGFDRMFSKNSCFASSSLWVKLEMFYPTLYEDSTEGIFSLERDESHKTIVCGK